VRFAKCPRCSTRRAALAGDIAVVEDEYAGLASSEERVAPIANALAKNAIAILPNHGAITTGPTVQLAAIRMLLLEGMCQRNISVGVAARATGLTPRPIKSEHAMTAKQEIAKIPFLQPFWKDLLTRLRQSDPDLFAGEAVAA